MSFFGKIHERILRKFLLHDVDFVLIGGHAVVFYGVRRTTADIDILVRPTLAKVFANAIEATIDNMAIKIIDIRDLLTNKENINRSNEKRFGGPAGYPGSEAYIKIQIVGNREPLRKPAMRFCRQAHHGSSRIIENACVLSVKSVFTLPHTEANNSEFL